MKRRFAPAAWRIAVRAARAPLRRRADRAQRLVGLVRLRLKRSRYAAGRAAEGTGTLRNGRHYARRAPQADRRLSMRESGRSSALDVSEVAGARFRRIVPRALTRGAGERQLPVRSSGAHSRLTERVSLWTWFGPFTAVVPRETTVIALVEATAVVKLGAQDRRTYRLGPPQR